MSSWRAKLFPFCSDPSAITVINSAMFAISNAARAQAYPKRLAQGIHNVVHRCRDENTQLIGESGHQSPDCVRREFVEVGGNDAPCALDACLQNECPDRQGQQDPPKVHAGIIARASNRARIMLRRRPTLSDRWPNTMAPITAPTLKRITR